MWELFTSIKYLQVDRYFIRGEQKKKTCETTYLNISTEI